MENFSSMNFNYSLLQIVLAWTQYEFPLEGRSKILESIPILHEFRLNSSNPIFRRSHIIIIVELHEVNLTLGI